MTEVEVYLANLSYWITMCQKDWEFQWFHVSILYAIYKVSQQVRAILYLASVSDVSSSKAIYLSFFGANFIYYNQPCRYRQINII